MLEIIEWEIHPGCCTTEFNSLMVLRGILIL